ncbi:MAG: TRAP transporter large permease subunit [Planctomycetes bacterium]|nr:TRAP transporter large permease subunit [Planctomycetota bacterium]
MSANTNSAPAGAAAGEPGGETVAGAGAAAAAGCPAGAVPESPAPGVDYIPGHYVEVAGWRGWVRGGENLLVTLVLAAMMLLPLAEIVLRKLVNAGYVGSSISNASGFLQHGTLLVGMLGGALAARDKRLLSLSTLTSLLKGRWKDAADLFAGVVSVSVTAGLGIAGYRLLASSYEYPRELAYGIEDWMFQLLIPGGFALIALRLVWHSHSSWLGRLLVLSLAGHFVWLGCCPPWPYEQMWIPALCLLGAGTLLGTPVFCTLGGAALILFWGDDQPIDSLTITQYGLVTNPTLPTIPLFTLAGYFLAEGGTSKRIVRVFQEWVGWFRGGPAIVTALACAFFTTFTGASGVTILALGALLMPVLIGAGYSQRNALGLVTSAGSLGLLFPPCLPLILYAIVANANFKDSGITIEKMFLGGIGPGVLLLAMTAAWGIWAGPKTPPGGHKSFNGGEARRALWEAKWELLLPVVAFVALFGGFATPVEAAAVTALYAFFVDVVLYRDLKIFKDVPRVMSECGLLVGGVLLILGVAVGFTNYLIDARIPDRLVEWVTASIHSPFMFLLALNGFLLIVGCLMDIFSAIVVVVPLILPIGKEFGIHPIHLGIIFLANLELGYLTPPVGMNLFLSSYRFHKPMIEVTRAILPMLLVLVIGVLLITYFPPLTTFLPSLVKTR